MRTKENIQTSPRPARPGPTRPIPRRPAAARFAVHYVEMVVAMAAGMLVLHPLWALATQGVSQENVLMSVEADTLIMATAMSIPMVVWMRFRGHTWAPVWEMSAAMYAGFVVLYPLLWVGAVDGTGVETYGHLLMLVFMLLAMLWRRQEYTAGHHDHRRPSEYGAGERPSARTTP